MSELNIHQRMNAVMRAVSYVQKDQNRVAGQYTAVKHDDVVRKIRPALVEHGIVVETDVIESTNEQFSIERRGGPVIQNRTKVRLEVRFVNVDKQDDRVVIHVDAVGEDPGDKSYGKAISYAKKYALLGTFLIETGDDADHDQSVERHAPARQKTETPRPVMAAFEAAAEIDADEARAIWKANRTMEARQRELEAFVHTNRGALSNAEAAGEPLPAGAVG